MRLTRFTDYALRVVIFVGHEGGRVCTMGEIAAYYSISLEHLRKVVHKLARLGYLESSRGRGGGLVLGRAPGAIRLGQLVLAMEEDLSIVDCKALNCILSSGCSLKTALDRGRRAFISALDETTLADLLDNRRMKQQFRSIRISSVLSSASSRT